jgi:hypothetical protein
MVPWGRGEQLPTITGNVGDGAANKTHDVALLQAMLRIVKNAKGAPYFSGNYDGPYGKATKDAITAFQNDNTDRIKPGQLGKEKLGVVDPGAATIVTLSTALPATHKNLRIIPGTNLVYLEGSQGDAQASASSIRNDAEFESTFKDLLARLVDSMYAEHKIVLKITPTGRRRTFAHQAAETSTFAGPGESNHNYGRAADIGFKGLSWIQADGTIKQDADWLNALEKTDKAKAYALWDARDAIARKLPLFPLEFERVHLQLYDQKTFSNINSLVRLLNTVGKAKWAAGYKSDFGVGGALYQVGTAKQIWAGNATVARTDLAAALTAKEAAAKSTRVFKEADITQKQITEVQATLKSDFEAADKNWIKWIKVT